MIKTIMGITIGALAGFAFHKLVGCPAGTCPITSSPFLSTFLGAMAGLLVSGIHWTVKENDVKKKV